MADHEKQAAKPEHERQVETGEDIAKYHEALRDRLEKEELENKTRESEGEALSKASELAKESDAKKVINENIEKDKPSQHRGAPSKKQLRDSFNEQMNSIQEELGGTSKVFSKFIHLPLVERTSDFIESTLARPTALLSGSVAAFLTIAIAYFIAKYYGFQLSGFETIGAFIIGWIFGYTYDYFRSKLRKK